MFWESFSAEFLATLIGLIIGIPIALWIDRRNSATRSRKDAKDTLTALKEEISRNKRALRHDLTKADKVRR